MLFLRLPESNDPRESQVINMIDYLKALSKVTPLMGYVTSVDYSHYIFIYQIKSSTLTPCVGSVLFFMLWVGDFSKNN